MKPHGFNRVVLFVVLAFVLRFGLAVFAYVYLPVIGHAESKPNQAGYLYLDAYNRDAQAFKLAQSDTPLLRAFSGTYETDQYGGLLWLSALIYRYLTGGTQQPLVIAFLAALVGSLGGFFVYFTARRVADEKIALLATAIFLFYPEAVLLGASQMREPFLMTFVAMAFYGVVALPKISKASEVLKTSEVYWIILSLAGMLTFSPGIAVIVLVAVAGWIYLGNEGHKIPWQMVAVAVGIFVLALVAVSLSWDNLVAAKGGGMVGVIGDWARETAKWNAQTLKSSSGIVQVMFNALPKGLVMPFVTIYGILQPVLPAAVIEPSVPFWQIIGIVRALGWYLLLPFVAFSPFSAWILPNERQRRQWVWLSLVVWTWIIIAAVRGGGDQWDNPRYRTILLVWLALLAAQAFFAVKSPAGRWFWRIVMVLAIILLVFTHWYSWRYTGFGYNLGIRNTIAIAIGLSTLAVAGDWLWTHWKRPNKL